MKFEARYLDFNLIQLHKRFILVTLTDILDPSSHEREHDARELRAAVPRLRCVGASVPASGTPGALAALGILLSAGAQETDFPNHPSKWC